MRIPPFCSPESSQANAAAVEMHLQPNPVGSAWTILPMNGGAPRPPGILPDVLSRTRAKVLRQFVGESTGVDILHVPDCQGLAVAKGYDLRPIRLRYAEVQVPNFLVHNFSVILKIVEHLHLRNAYAIGSRHGLCRFRASPLSCQQVTMGTPSFTRPRLP